MTARAHCSLLSAIVLASVLIIVAPWVHAPAAAQGPLLIGPPGCSAGMVQDANGATVTRNGAAMKPGLLARASGQFKKPKDVMANCDPAVVLGPFTLPGAGKLKGHVMGNPPVPNEWSTFNNNTTMTILYAPHLGLSYGPYQPLLTVQGQTTNNDVVAEAVWDQPGRVEIHISAPSGGGVFRGGCFDQSYTASVEVVELKVQLPIFAGDPVYPGDRISTGPNGGAVVQTPGGGLQSAGPNSAFVFEPGTAGGTPSLKAPEYLAGLNSKLRDLGQAGWPMPGTWQNNDLPFGVYRDSTLEELYNRIKDEPNPCEAAVLAKLFLQTHDNEWTAKKVTTLISTVGADYLLPNWWDAAALAAKGRSAFLEARFAAKSSTSNWTAIINHVYQSFRSASAARQSQVALDAFTGSKGWSPADVDRRLGELDQGTADKDRQIEEAWVKLKVDVDVLRNDLTFAKTGVPGGCLNPTLGTEEACQIAVNRFVGDRDALVRASLNQVGGLLSEKYDLEVQKGVLRRYRGRIADGTCDELRQPPQDPLTPAPPCPTQTKLESGALRQKGPGVVVVGGNRVETKGTEFIAEQNGDVSTVKVVEGEVAITTAAGQALTVSAGKQIELPAGTVTDFDVKADDGGLIDGLPLRDLALDPAPEPYGTQETAFADNRIPPGWVWQDPGNDARIETPDANTLRITVPDGNEFYQATSTAPRLLHKITGDFTLEGELQQECQCQSGAFSDFILYSPGNYLGYLAKQMERDSLAGQYRILSAWIRMDGKNKLTTLLRDGTPTKTWDQGADAPDKPVRFRLIRRGDLWKTYWSADDGQTWNVADRQVIRAPDTLWVGWDFKRVALDGLRDVPAVNTLRGVRLTSAPRGGLDDADWDIDAAAGSVKVEGGTFHFALDGKNTANPVQVAALDPRRLDGDFDASVTFNVDPLPAQADRIRWWMLGASSLDGQNMTYVRGTQFPAEGYRFDTDVRKDGGWLNYKSIKAEKPTGHLRLARRGQQVTAYTWLEGQWLPIAVHEGLTGTVSLELDVLTDPGPSPLPLNVSFTLDSVTEAPTDAQGPWQPADLNAFDAADLPTPLGLPEGVQAAAFRSPYALGRLFFGNDGAAYIFSKAQGQQTLLAMDGLGTARPFAQSKLLAGINSKSGVWLDGQVLVAVDGWRPGGNDFMGFFRLSPDGSFVPWKLSTDYPGLGDVIPAPQGGWYFCDFERRNAWYLSGEGQPEKPLLAPGDTPGLAALAVDPADGALYGLNWAQFGGTPGIYRIADDRADLVWKHPDGKDLEVIAFSPGGAFPAGLYASDPASGSILRITPGGEAEPVITGLTNPGPLGFSPTSGDLYVVCDGQTVMIAYNKSAAPPPAPPTEVAPAEAPTVTPTRGLAGRSKAGVGISGSTPTVKAASRPTATPVKPTATARPTATKLNRFAASFAGTWDTNYGILTLVLQGGRVTGNYPWDDGQITGVLSPDGHTLTGTWSETPTRLPPQDAGQVVFHLAQDGQSLTGEWGYGDRLTDGAWIGTRAATPGASDVAPAAAPTLTRHGAPIQTTVPGAPGGD